jgi:hypothetical protein
MGDYVLAQTHFLKALEIKPDDPNAQRGLADVEFWLKFLKDEQQ